MPLIVVCPNGHPLQVQEQHVGAIVQCPTCKVHLRIGAPPSPSPAPAPPPAAPLILENELDLAPFSPSSRPVPQPPPARAEAWTEPPRHDIQPAIRPASLAPSLPAAEEVIELSQADSTPPEPPPADLQELLELTERPQSIAPTRKPRRRKTTPAVEENDSTEAISAQMGRVNLGLGFLYCSMLCLVASFVLTMLAVSVLPLMIQGERVAAEKGGKGRGSTVVITCAGCGNLSLSLVGGLSGAVGALLCCFVPTRARVTPFIVASVAVEGVALLLTVVGGIQNQSEPDEGLTVLHLSRFLSVTGWVLFMLFLCGLARFLGDEPSAAEALQFLFLQLGLILATVLALVVITASTRTYPLSGAFVMLGASLVALGLNIKILLGALRVIGTIRQHITSRC